MLCQELYVYAAPNLRRQRCEGEGGSGEGWGLDKKKENPQFSASFFNLKCSELRDRKHTQRILRWQTDC